MLSALQGLLTKPVAVIVVALIAGGRRPVAVMRGTLRVGAEIQNADDFYGLPGEVLAFVIGDRDSSFFVRRPDFKLGRRDGDELSFQTGRVRVSVRPMPEA